MMKLNTTGSSQQVTTGTSSRVPQDSDSKVKPAEVKTKLVKFMQTQKKIPVALRTILNLKDNDCISLLTKLSASQATSDKEQVLHEMVDTLIPPDLSYDKLQDVNRVITETPLVPALLSEMDIQTPQYTQQKCVDPRGYPFTELSQNRLFWNCYDHDSNEARISAINDVTQWICLNYPKISGGRITIISMGTAGLMMEQLVHEQLTKSGIADKNIEWRCIDITYGNYNHQNPNSEKDFKPARDQFKKGKNVRYFTTATAYLGKTIDKQKLSVTDKEKSAVIILSFNPPTKIVNTEEKTEGFQPCGAPCPVEKANSCFLWLGEKEHQDEYEQHAKHLNAATQCNFQLIPSIRASIGPDGEPRLLMSRALEDTFPQKFRTKLENTFNHAYLQKDHNLPVLIRAKEALTDLADLFIKGQKSAVVVSYSDYFGSVEQLTHHFYGGLSADTSPGALFELIKQQRTITDRSDFVH